MTRLPVVDFERMDKVLRHLGFEFVRQKGSHVFYRHTDGRNTTLPNYRGRDIARPLIRGIIREINLPPEQFREILDTI